MIKPSDPRQLAIDIMKRSICVVRVGACITDRSGSICGWGWNSCWTGYGIHAEIHAIKRTNHSRLEGATVYVASERSRNSKAINSRPCESCQPFIKKWGLRAVFRSSSGEWVEL